MAICSATKPGPSSRIGLHWTDEELIMSLARMSKGPPFPDNVIDYVDPYEYNPSNLPVDIWFYISPDQKKDLENGSWKAKGQPFEIFSNSSFTGFRTTLEFYEGRAPHAQITNWVMQEYSIIQKEMDHSKNYKGSNLLCRVFLTSETIENKKPLPDWDCSENAGVGCLHPKPFVDPDTGNNLGLGIAEVESRVGNIEPSRIIGEHQQHNCLAGDLFETNCIEQGDYLELDDLLNSGSQSFSSDNSSRVTISSDECFDSLALLKDLEDEYYKDGEAKKANINYSVAASAKAKEMVVPPVASGSLTGTNNERQSPKQAKERRVRDENIVKNILEMQNVKNGNKSKSSSSSEDEEASTSRPKSRSKGEKKRSGGRLKKLNKKYLCFMPF